MSYYNNTSNIPCKYFQQGRCNRGNSCKFAHVYSSNNNGQKSSEDSISEAELYKSFVNPNSLAKIEKSILSGLQDSEGFQTKPLTSAYSYGTPCMVNLISGRDYSLEESRFNYYQCQKNNNINQYELEMQSRATDMQKCFTHIKSHPDWAARYLQKNTKDLMEKGEISIKKEFVDFPLDLTGSSYQNNNVSAAGSNPFTGGKSEFGKNTISTGGVFGTNANASSGAFGQPTFGSTNGGAFGFGSTNMNQNATSNVTGSAFGTPKFGNNVHTGNQNTTGVFGKPEFGFNSSSSAFNNPSASQSTPSNTLGGSAQSAATGTGSIFGKPQFGAKSTQQPSKAFGSNAFGAPSFGSSNIGNSNTSPFGSLQNAANNQTASPFSTLQNNQSTAPNQPSSPFSAIQNNPNGNSRITSPFGSLQNNNTVTSISPFASLNKTSTTPFGASQSNTNSVFGQGMVKNSTSTTPSGFGNQSSHADTSSSLFGSLNQKKYTNNFGSMTTPFGSDIQEQTATQTNFKVGQGTFGEFSNPNSVQLNRMQTCIPTQSARFVQGLPSEEEKMSANDLDKQTREQFEAPSFMLSKVPDIPPPLALITN